MIIIILTILTLGTIVYNYMGNSGFEISLILKRLKSKDFEIGISSHTEFRDDHYCDIVALGFFFFQVEIGFVKEYVDSEAE